MLIKFGITDIRDIETKGSTFFGHRQKNVTVTLYDQILQEPDAEVIAERILLLFTDKRGAYKRTYSQRFEGFDRAVLEKLVDIINKDTTLLVKDTGISDGRTAFDFFAKLSSIYPRLEYTASDFGPRVNILEKGRFKITISDTGKILEILFPPFVFNTVKPDSPFRFPVNRLIQFGVEHLYVAPLLREYAAGKIKARELLLFAPQVLKAAAEDPRLVLEQHDLLQPFATRAHIIRAMNVLNPPYFSSDEFNKILGHIHAGLLEGGVFITGSNQDAGSLVHGAVYQKGPAGFVEVWSSGDGSPVRQIISHWEPTGCQHA